MAERLRILFGEDEIVRLHEVAYAAAIQTGAKGIELDHVTSEVFRALAMEANRAELRTRERPSLRVVEA